MVSPTVQTIGFHALTGVAGSGMERERRSGVGSRNETLRAWGMNMNKIKLVLAVSLVAALAACDDEAYRSSERDAPPPPPPVEAAPAVEDEAVDSAATTTDAPPVDYSALPPPPESSEESVQPESETLFY